MPFFRFETQALQNGIPKPLVNFSVSCVMGSDPMTPSRRSLRLAPLDLRYTERPLVTLSVVCLLADPSFPLRPIATL